jgi:protein-tyrosine phosphatase
MKNILTVCIGNICRSPMAEGILASALPELQIGSAGIGALVGQPADELAQELMRGRGLDISKHRARQITQILCQHADVILVMDQEQRRFIEARYPSACGKVFRIGEAAKQDIPDPYRQGPEAFAHAFALIEKSTQVWIERIKKITEQERQFT